MLISTTHVYKLGTRAHYTTHHRHYSIMKCCLFTCVAVVLVTTSNALLNDDDEPPSSIPVSTSGYKCDHGQCDRRGQCRSAESPDPEQLQKCSSIDVASMLWVNYEIYTNTTAVYGFGSKNYCMRDDRLMCLSMNSTCVDSQTWMLKNCVPRSRVMASDYLTVDGGVCETPCEYRNSGDGFMCRRIRRLNEISESPYNQRTVLTTCYPPADKSAALKWATRGCTINAPVSGLPQHTCRSPSNSMSPDEHISVKQIAANYEKLFPTGIVHDDKYTSIINYTMYPYVNSTDKLIRYLPLSVNAVIRHYNYPWRYESEILSEDKYWYEINVNPQHPCEKIQTLIPSFLGGLGRPYNMYPGWNIHVTNRWKVLFADIARYLYKNEGGYVKLLGVLIYSDGVGTTNNVPERVGYSVECYDERGVIRPCAPSSRYTDSELIDLYVDMTLPNECSMIF